MNNKEICDFFANNKSKELYNDILEKYNINYKKCRCCNKPIYYYNSSFKSNKKEIYVINKSYKTKKTIFGIDYYLTVCEDCIIDKFPKYINLNKSRIFNRICDITEYAFNIPIDISEKWKNENYAITLEHFIKKYGENVGNIKWKSYCEKQSLTNTFLYKNEKYGWNDDDFITYNKSRSITLQNLINKYGNDIGVKMWDTYINKQKQTKSKNYVIEKYGEKYWNELCIKKSHSLKNTISRLGKTEGINVYKNKFNNIKEYTASKNSQKFFKNIDIILKNKYTTFYQDKNGEYCVFDDELGFMFLDYFIKELNLVIEFNGDIWHANPKKYNDDDIIPILNKTAKEIRNKDLYKYKKLKENFNFKIYIIWEHELPNLSDLIDYIEKININENNYGEI